MTITTKYGLTIKSSNFLEEISANPCNGYNQAEQRNHEAVNGFGVNTCPPWYEAPTVEQYMADGLVQSAFERSPLRRYYFSVKGSCSPTHGWTQLSEIRLAQQPAPADLLDEQEGEGIHELFSSTFGGQLLIDGYFLTTEPMFEIQNQIEKIIERYENYILHGRG
jgi:hypothetical protein